MRSIEFLIETDAAPSLFDIIKHSTTLQWLDERTNEIIHSINVETNYGIIPIKTTIPPTDRNEILSELQQVIEARPVELATHPIYQKIEKLIVVLK